MMNSVLLLGFIIMTVCVGYFSRLLTLSGSITAAVVGIMTTIAFGLEGLILLGTFFGTSSFWSKFQRSQKKLAEERHAKGSQRDFSQVLANGGIASISSLLYILTNDPLWIFTFCVALASANSDTWASEVGTLSKKNPFSIRNFAIVQSGTSGAISMLGTIAGILGSLVIATISTVLFEFNPFLTLLIFLIGFLGNIFDTILGAYIQAVYECTICKAETEKEEHCSKVTTLKRGAKWCNNDVVNFLSSFLAVICGILIYKL